MASLWSDVSVTVLSTWLSCEPLEEISWSDPRGVFWREKEDQKLVLLTLASNSGRPRELTLQSRHPTVFCPCVFPAPSGGRHSLSVCDPPGFLASCPCILSIFRFLPWFSSHCN